MDAADSELRNGNDGGGPDGVVKGEERPVRRMEGQLNKSPL
jgi:hypothetical protein